MRYKHCCYFALAVTVGTSLAAQNASQRPRAPRVYSPGLVPPAGPTAPVVDPQRKRVVETQQPAIEPVLEQGEEQQAASGPPLEEGGRLDLMCFGGGSANKTDIVTVDGEHSTSGSFHTNGGTFGSYSGSGSSSATILAPRSQAFDDQVSLFIENGQGRVRMPRTMLPAIRGGENGWFKLKNVEIKSNEITASVAVNVFSNPKLRLDRFSGTISISGRVGDYTGRCQRFNPQQIQRRF